jgi:hypothetical protein
MIMGRAGIDADPGVAGQIPPAATIAAFTAAFLLLAWPWLSGTVTIPWDAKAQFQPQLQFLANALAGRDSPFWTPNVFAGWPQIADPQSLLFSPLHLLLVWLDPGFGFQAADAVTFMALFLGGLAIIAIFADRGWNGAGALVAALAFAFGGSAAARIQHTSEVLSLAYLPPALWLLTRALQRSSWRSGIAAGVVAGLIAADRDQVALLGLYLLVGMVVHHWIECGVAGVRTSAKPLAGAALAGAVVTAIPVVLTALLAARSNRPEIAYAFAGTGSLHPALLLTSAFADLFATNNPAIPYWGPPSDPWGPTGLILAQNMGEIYAGAVPLVALLGIGLGGGFLWARDIRPFTIALAIFLLFALGWYTPAFGVLFHLLPGVSLYRRPADATFVIGLLYALIAGYSVHRWLADTARASTLQRLAMAALPVAFLAAAVGVALASGKLDVSRSPILYGLGWAGLALAALGAARRWRDQPLIAAGVIAAALTLDLAWNNGPNPSTGLPPAAYDALRPDTTNETIARLRKGLGQTAAPDRRDRVELAGIGYHWPNIGLVHGFDHVFGQNPLRLGDFATATGVGDTVATPEQRTFSPLYPSFRSAFADLLGVRFIATGVPVERIDKALKPGDLAFVARTPDAWLYENPRALPRVMVIADWQLADFAQLIRTGWPDVDPGRTVLLEQAPSDLPALAKSPAAVGSARIKHYGNAEVVVTAEAPAGGFLLLTDVWHPWWRASVDGNPAPILKADVLFRAVRLPPGQHEIRFEFYPLRGAWGELRQKLGY